MNLWLKLQEMGLIKREPHPHVTAECARFKDDQAFQTYLDEAMFRIANDLLALQVEDIDGFTQLKRSQMALQGLNDFIDGAIMSEVMKNRKK